MRRTFVACWADAVRRVSAGTPVTATAAAQINSRLRITPLITMNKRKREIILKTDQRTLLLELGLQGKFSVKSSGWGENRVVGGDHVEAPCNEAAGL